MGPGFGLAPDRSALDGASLEETLDAVRLRAVFAAANDAFFDVDLHDMTIRWSKGITLLLGHEPARIGDRLIAWQGLIHPDDAAAVIASGRELVPTPATTWSDEFRMRRADASYAPVRVRAFFVRDEEGRATHVVGAVTDLAPIRQLEEELRDASERLAVELAIERQERIRAELLMRASTTDVLWEWWLDEDRMVWSPNVEMVLGYPSSALGNVGAIAARSPEIALDLDEMRRRITFAGTNAWARRFTWILPSGGELTLEAQAYVLRHPTGRSERVIGSIRHVVLPDGPGPDVQLTVRQRQVLSLVRLGHTNKEIASALGISEQAAKVQVSKLLKRFGVSNRAALAVAGRSYASF